MRAHFLLRVREYELRTRASSRLQSLPKICDCSPTKTTQKNKATRRTQTRPDRIAGLQNIERELLGRVQTSIRLHHDTTDERSKRRFRVQTLVFGTTASRRANGVEQKSA